MRKVLLSVLALSTVAVAAPAAAQNYRHHDTGIERQLDSIAQRVRQAENRGRISHREANGLLRRADQIDRLHDRYARNGLSRGERDDLRRQVNRLQQDLRFERQDNNNRPGKRIGW
ncbi:hypothetical protein [Allosphingosinicella vermicomposti]|uniref:hypothetical protein n=1 Tax=Allosphingosinicella vermicomposti TaxID=614671 RepID=UPI000D0F6AD5|nr:hypothetical protein [Allosphingosinicella vermicomposti]